MDPMLQYAPVAAYLQVIQILVSLVLMVLVLMQSRGSGLTQPSMEQTTLFRTRRGIEKTLFQLTLVLAVVWVLVSIATTLAYNVV
jgi:preprotein translocase subunit SecG